MKALAFIRAFETFMARRGTPDIVINYNFKTFKSSVGNKFMLCLGAPQKFILPASTWWGAFYKQLVRSVRSVKMSLEKILGKPLLSYEQLETVLLKIESVINGGSLANLSEYDFIYDFMPNYLICGRNIRTKSNEFVVTSKTEERTVCQCPIQKLILFELTAITLNLVITNLSRIVRGKMKGTY